MVWGVSRYDNYKRKYEQLKTDGICTRCRKRTPEKGAFQCTICVERSKKPKVKKWKKVKQ